MTAEEFITREQEIREAMAAFPDTEMGEAYKRWCEMRGKKPTMLSTTDPTMKAVRTAILQTFRRPCPQSGCDGEQVLEGVCEGCIEGKAGYRSKWTCEKCMHRELSKKIYLDWYNELKEK
jgi:hypothetical protein